MVDFSSLGHLVLVGAGAYIWLIVVLRVSGKRTLAQLNAFDFVITVAFGSTLASVILNRSVPWMEGAAALALLALLQFVVAWTAVRVSWVRQATTSAPTVLLRDGQPIRQALTEQRISDESLRQAVRSSGVGGLDLVAAVVLEVNGTLSVITTSQLGSGDAISEVSGSRGFQE